MAFLGVGKEISWKHTDCLKLKFFLITAVPVNAIQLSNILFYNIIISEIIYVMYLLCLLYIVAVGERFDFRSLLYLCKVSV